MTTQPTTGAPPAAGPDAFADYLASHQDELVASLARDASLAGLPDERRGEVAAAIVGVFVGATGDLGATAGCVGSLLERPDVAGLGERLLNELFVGLRGRLLDIALRGVVSGVAGSQAAVHRLMSQVNIAHVTVLGFYQERADAELRLFRELFEHAPYSIVVAGLDGSVLHANTAFRNGAGLQEDAGTVNVIELGASDPALRRQIEDSLAARGVWQGLTPYRHADGAEVTSHNTIFYIRDSQGAPRAFATISRDVTDQLRREAELRESQEQLIQAQQAALRELSTPLIPLADGVVAMPLIGSIDSSRAQLVIETLLDGVSLNHARVAILDITGVPVVDTQVANALIRAAQAVKLLGAQVVLTGIRPEVAQTLVGLGVDLTGIVTRSSFQAGIAFALER